MDVNTHAAWDVLLNIKAHLANKLMVNATLNVRKHFGAISVTNIVERAAVATLVTELQAIV